MKLKITLMCISFAFVSSACATMYGSAIKSDATLVQSAANALGDKPENLVLLNRVNDDANTYLTVKDRSGTTYVCTISGGGISFFGMSSPPKCNKK